MHPIGHPRVSSAARGGNPGVILAYLEVVGDHLDLSGGLSESGDIWTHRDVIWAIHGVIWGRLGGIWGTYGVTRRSMEGPWEGNVLMSRRFKLFVSYVQNFHGFYLFMSRLFPYRSIAQTTASQG